MTTILFILEGERTEPSILKKLETSFFNKDDNKQRISVCFKTDIFAFYDELKDGEGFLDPFSVLKEKNPDVCTEIKSSEEISAIYLFSIMISMLIEVCLMKKKAIRSMSYCNFLTMKRKTAYS